MADGSGGVSGIAVALVACGGLLVASAIRNVSPVDTLKQVIGRSPARPAAIGTALGSATSGVRSVQVGEAAGPIVRGVAGAATGDAGRFVSAARKYLGVPYVYGGTSRKGIDCSGLVIASLRDIGRQGVPRFTTVTFGTWARSEGAKRLSPDQFRAGDVVCRTGHMGIAVSATRMIHAPHAGTVVKEAAIYDRANWWGWRLL